MRPTGPTPIPESLYRRRRMRPERFLQPAKWALIVLASLASFAGFSVWRAYRSPFPHPMLVSAAGHVPLPALRVNGRRVLYRDLAALNTIVTHTDQAEPLETAIDLAVERALTLDMAEQLNVELNETRVDAVMDMLLDSYHEESEARRAIAQAYGVDIVTFRRLIAEVKVYAQQLEQPVYAHGPWQTEVRERAERLHQAAFKDVSLLSDVGHEAVGYAQVSARPLSGFPVEARDAILATPAGLVAPLVETPDAFVVYHVVERQQGEEEGLFTTRSVRIQKTRVQEVRDRLKQEARVTYYIPPPET